jgi:hypothetical protein
MPKLTTRQNYLLVRVRKRNAKLKCNEYYPVKGLSTKRRKIIAENDAIVKRLRNELK